MTALDLFKQLRDFGVALTPYPNGTVRYKAPKGVLTPGLVNTMRDHKAELHALVEAWSERAAIAEFCSGLARPAAEALAWRCVLTPHDGCAACGVEDGQEPQDHLRQP